jgi:hypothetical protein
MHSQPQKFQVSCVQFCPDMFPTIEAYSMTHPDMMGQVIG